MQKSKLLKRLLNAKFDTFEVGPFFAKYDPNAMWLDDLKPLNEEKFFFEEELRNLKQNDDYWFSNNQALIEDSIQT